MARSPRAKSDARSSGPLDKASDRLMASLWDIGTHLKYTGVDHPPWAPPDAALFRELGETLRKILEGQPAGQLFRQNEKTKPKNQRQLEKHIAILYWLSCACVGKVAGNAAAISLVKSAKSLKPPKSPSYIQRIARKHRESALVYLEVHARENQFPTHLLHWCFVDHDVTPEGVRAHWAAVLEKTNAAVKSLTPVKVAWLREYLRKKRRRPDVDK
jgi:hypothetical protein